MASKPYNDIYERLTNAVSGEDLLVGMLAYSLYKKGKAEVCEAARQSGTPLTPADLANYHASFTATAQSAFETKARETLFAFANEYLELQKPRIIEEAIGSLQGVMTAQSEKIETKIASSTSFSKAFWPGIASSVAFFVVAAIIALAWASENRETMRSFLSGTSPSAHDGSATKK
ncbi:hypothetical protein [Pseudoduganella aquatica]|uniref:Uncharacterized protein n=1 Tax=Pseudoduganella aquatica TaxID=2660641 RepID=A0A7X4HFE5_9BURK|nr:hypothetical protein [Pseudoduganella aquatica]MYN10185.1 hypothetical protein [Pseudoduganella aquatica]